MCRAYDLDFGTSLLEQIAAAAAAAGSWWCHRAPASKRTRPICRLCQVAVVVAAHIAAEASKERADSLITRRRATGLPPGVVDLWVDINKTGRVRPRSSPVVPRVAHCATNRATSVQCPTTAWYVSGECIRGFP
ncbi:unnamed protein product [Lampetra fluviatilis]